MATPAAVRFAVPLRPTVGIRPLDPADWLVVDDRRGPELLAKADLLAHRNDEVFAAEPGTDDAGAETLDLVLAHYAAHHPGLLRRDGSAITDRGTGLTVEVPAQHPLEAAGRLAAEDLCLMVRRGDEWVLAAASLCFPSRWRLADKLGRPISAIHDPVPGFAGPVARASAAALDRLGPEDLVIRFNWSLLDDPTLFQPDSPQQAAPVTDPGHQLFLRVERQTLRLLPRTGAVLFTIHTTVEGLSAVAADAERARALAAALRSADGPVRTYKGWEHTADAAAEWLEDHAGAVLAPPSPGGAE